MLTTLLIALLIAALIVVFAFWAIDAIPVAPPFNQMLKIIVIVLAVLVIVQRSGIVI